jgi:hypothetical protein
MIKKSFSQKYQNGGADHSEIIRVSGVLQEE